MIVNIQKHGPEHYSGHVIGALMIRADGANESEVRERCRLNVLERFGTLSAFERRYGIPHARKVRILTRAGGYRVCGDLCGLYAGLVQRGGRVLDDMTMSVSNRHIAGVRKWFKELELDGEVQHGWE